MIKNFMCSTFPKIIDILVILSFIGVFIGAIAYAIIAGQFGGVASGILTFMLSLVLGAVGVIIFFGAIYTLLDIRDSLKKQ